MLYVFVSERVILMEASQTSLLCVIRFIFIFVMVE